MGGQYGAVKPVYRQPEINESLHLSQPFSGIDSVEIAGI
jgi:hypothetical protein